MIADPTQLPVPPPASAHSEGAQTPPLTSTINRTSHIDAMLRRKEQKDAELDRKIEALRKKNEALMKRYQEVEEDKKRAEQEGMALRGPRGKAEDLTITINKSNNEARVVRKKSRSSGSSAPQAALEPAEGKPNCSTAGAGRGKRRQLLVTTGGGTKGRRVVSEKKGPDQRPGSGVQGNTGEQEEDAELVRRGKPPLGLKGDTRAQEDEVEQEHSCSVEESTNCDPYYQDDEGSTRQALGDLSLPTSKEEQLEYLRWKREREQIDRERVARHRNAKGQWRRAWDVDKPEGVYRERFHKEPDLANQIRGGRNAKRGNPRSFTDPRGHPHRTREKGSKSLQAVGSKAKGKDRLTGRARRWDCKEGEEDEQAPVTSLEEFLEELDTCGEANVEDTMSETTGEKAQDGEVVLDHSPGDSKEATDPKPDRGVGSVDSHEDRGQKLASIEPLPRRTPEKKVRFSADAKAVDGTIQHTGELSSGCHQPGHQETVSDGDGVAPHVRLVQKEDITLPEAPNPRTSSNESERLSQRSVQGGLPVGHPEDCTKSSLARCAGEMIDTGLSVLTVDSGSSQPIHKSSTDKAKENGKIV